MRVVLVDGRFGQYRTLWRVARRADATVTCRTVDAATTTPAIGVICRTSVHLCLVGGGGYSLPWREDRATSSSIPIS